MHTPAYTLETGNYENARSGAYNFFLCTFKLDSKYGFCVQTPNGIVLCIICKMYCGCKESSRHIISEFEIECIEAIRQWYPGDFHYHMHIYAMPLLFYDHNIEDGLNWLLCVCKIALVLIFTNRWSRFELRIIFMKWLIVWNDNWWLAVGG